MAPSWGLLLVNLGTPASTEVRDVRRYLREFLSDPRVLTMPAPARAALLNLVILPFRPARSAEAYRKVWLEEGSPLLVHGRALAAKVRERLGEGAMVELAMRYQEPALSGALERFRAAGVDRIVVLPLYPHYASSSWGSTAEAVYRLAAAHNNVAALQLVPPFYDHPAFVEAFAGVARPVIAEQEPDVVLMSFHGLPESHMTDADESGGAHCLQADDCCAAIGRANRHCYRAQCFATARALAAALDLGEDAWTVAFQSRLGRTPWIRPYTDEVIPRLAKEGKRRLAVICPAFVADCLETIEEIGIRARGDFLAAGGEDLRLVPSLNAEDAWADAVVRLVRETSAWPAAADREPAGR